MPLFSLLCFFMTPTVETSLQRCIQPSYPVPPTESCFFFTLACYRFSSRIVSSVDFLPFDNRMI